VNGSNRSNSGGTYREIAAWVRENCGFTPKTCWIADVKSYHGLTRGAAPNRYGPGRVHPCPTEKRRAIEAALRHFGQLAD
jgi:hypothetical protein